MEPAAERRRISVMACELDEPGDARLDPEDLLRVMRGYHDLCEQVVERHGGILARRDGRRTVAYFGYPQAHEDDPLQAAAASLELLESLPELARRLGSNPLALRIAVDAGPVVISGLPPDVIAIGDAPRGAEELLGMVPAGTVGVGPPAQQVLQGSVLLEPLGAQVVDRDGGLVALQRLVAARPEGSGFERKRRAGLTPLIGRRSELGGLERCWREVAGGGTRAVLVRGEAGVGKSRLVHAFRRRRAGDGVGWFEARCSPYFANTPLHAVIEIFEQALELDAASTLEERLASLERRIASLGIAQGDAVGALAQLLSLPLSPAPGETSQPLTRRLAALWDAVLRARGGGAPLVVVFEDVQWADRSTLELLGAFLRRAPADPSLVVLTSRPEFSTPWAPDESLSVLDVPRLRPEDTQRMIEWLSRGAQLSAPVRATLVAASDGIPLAVEELTRSALERGDSFATDSNLEIPATLYDSLAARLDRLGDARRVAQLAATIGREFASDLLAAVLEEETCSADEGIRRLTEAGLVESAGAGRHAFRHALIQETAYQSLLVGDRQIIHARILGALEAHFPAERESTPELLAAHAEAAGDPAKAAFYWQLAGSRAIARSANEEAIAQLGRAAERMRELPSDPDLRGQELLILFMLTVPLMASRGYAAAEVAETYARCRQLSEELGDVPQPFPVVLGLWGYYLTRGELPTARELADRRLHHAENLENPVFRVLAFLSLGITSLYQGDIRDCFSSLARAFSHYDTSQRQTYAILYEPDAGVTALAYAAWAQWMLGEADAACRTSDEAVALARRLEHPHSVACALTMAAGIRGERREIDALRERTAEALALGERHGFPQWSAVSSVLEGWAGVRAGAGEAALETLERGIEAYRRTGARISQTYLRALLVDAQLCLGHIERGLMTAADALDDVERRGEHLYEAELLRLRGTLLAAAGETDAAERSLREALVCARQRSAASLELRAATDLASLLRDAGKVATAREILEPVRAHVVEGADSGDPRAADTLLRELDAETAGAV